MIRTLIDLSRFQKQFLMLFFDFAAVIIILLISFSIRYGYFFVPVGDLVWIILGAPIISIPIFWRFGLYREIIRYIGFKALWSIIQSVTLYALLWSLVAFMASVGVIPRSVILINWLLGIVIIGGSRMAVRWLLTENNFKNINVVIYGAGSAGRQLSIALTQSHEYNPVAFIDDNTDLQRQSINGIEVYSRKNLEQLKIHKNVTEVLIAMPSLRRSQRKKVINFLEPYQLHVRSLPGVSELAQGKVRVSDLREVSVKDLLGRDAVAPNKDLLTQNITDKVVMVTGAGGSIGSEICRQILLLKPQALILFERNEFALYNINQELSKATMSSIKVFPILGSVNNKNRLSQVLKKFNVHTIYHAAAYKHVPLVEYNTAEGVSNNIFGTLNCAQVAIESGVHTFVLISTDKAVRPTNTMGATKRIAEMVLQALTLLQVEKKHHSNVYSDEDLAIHKETCFSIVRFGNVLDSSGSVIPLFKDQIKQGGPVTVTDAEVQRFFMSIPEAVELVIQAGAMAKGGDVFVLDMGEPVLIKDLALKMIRLSGLEVKDELHPDGDIEVKYTGLRPGEKMYEELVIGKNISKTNNPMIMTADEEMILWDRLKIIIDELEEAVDLGDHDKLRRVLIKAVPGFEPQSDITDVLYDI